MIFTTTYENPNPSLLAQSREAIVNNFLAGIMAKYPDDFIIRENGKVFDLYGNLLVDKNEINQRINHISGLI